MEGTLHLNYYCLLLSLNVNIIKIEIFIHRVTKVKIIKKMYKRNKKP
jgi:hypothetical protein